MNLDRMRSALAKLTSVMLAHASQAITYARGTDSVIVPAVIGNMLLKLDDGMGGLRMEYTDLDVIVPTTTLLFGDVPVTPTRGDLVFLPVKGDSEVKVFEVSPYGSEPCYRLADSAGQTAYRIHCKHIDTEPFTLP